MADRKKLMGRPKMEGGKRTKKVDVRFTEDEYVILEKLETELGLSKTELLRRRALAKGTAIVLNSKEMIRALDAIGTEMGRSGNNINQLAKHANTLKLQGAISVEVAERHNQLLEEYIGMQRLLESVLRKIIRMMGNG